MMKRIVLVDDDPGVRKALEIGLFRSGFEVISVESGMRAMQAIEELVSESRPVDLLVTDFRMPKMNGLQLIQKAKNIQPLLLTILLTGYGNETLQEECKRIGVNLYMEKPFNPKILVQNIFDLLEEWHKNQIVSGRRVSGKASDVAVGT